jgi:hydrogenase nickel incorporation protein HypA/HybF
MHEMSIAQNILEIVEDALRDEVEPQVEKVFVEIGQLVAIVPDSLDFCYTALAQGTRLADSKLIISEVPIQIRCENCERTSRVELFDFCCPHCGNTQLETLTGNELAVSHIEVN